MLKIKAVVCSAIVMTCVSSLWADRIVYDDVTLKKSFYVGGVLPYNTLGGDFNGDQFYTDGVSKAVLVPELDNALGLGIAAGFRNNLSEKFGIGLEVSYLQSKHNGSFAEMIDTDATYRLLNLDLKLFGNVNRPFQPFMLIGLNIPSLKVENAYQSTTEESDATYRGGGINLGAGLLYFVNRSFALQGTGVLRKKSFDEVEFKGERVDIKPELDSTDFSVEFAMLWYINLK